MDKDKKIITLHMKIEIPINEIGEMLICDDSASYPLVGYGYDIQRELYRILGWNKEISKRLENEALDDNIEIENTWQEYYTKWANKAQRWAEEKIKDLGLE